MFNQCTTHFLHAALGPVACQMDHGDTTDAYQHATYDKHGEYQLLWQTDDPASYDGNTLPDHLIGPGSVITHTDGSHMQVIENHGTYLLCMFTTEFGPETFDLDLTELHAPDSDWTLTRPVPPAAA